AKDAFWVGTRPQEFVSPLSVASPSPLGESVGSKLLILLATGSFPKSGSFLFSDAGGRCSGDDWARVGVATPTISPAATQSVVMQANARSQRPCSNRYRLTCFSLQLDRSCVQWAIVGFGSGRKTGSTCAPSSFAPRRCLVSPFLPAAQNGD